MASKHIHVVAKANTAEHHVVTSSTASLPALVDGQIRVRSLLVGLTSNNMAYATQGTRLHWWNAFPVPADLPAPYNDRTSYGIVPTWGYGEVLESRTSSIEAGRLIWGFWPSSELPVDLQLKPAGVEGHFVDVTEARGSLMNMYRRYILADADLTAASLADEAVFTRLARAANCRTVWEGGYALNKAVFGQSPVHPAGSGEWSQEKADLSSAVVVALSASGRTARSFADNIFNERPAESGPLALVAITSNAHANVYRQPRIPTNVVSYKDMSSQGTFDWMAPHKPKKIVVIDFGGRDNAFDALFSDIENAFPDLDVMAIGVGAEAKAHSAEDMGKFDQRNALPNREMMNTTGTRDAMMANLGEAEYFAGLEKAWRGFLDRGCVDDMRLIVGEGIMGDRGFERGWSDLCAGKLAVDEAMVYKM